MSYSMKENEYVDIDAESGTIRTLVDLDEFTIGRRFVVDVDVSDDGLPVKSDTSRLVFEVAGENKYKLVKFV